MYLTRICLSPPLIFLPAFTAVRSNPVDSFTTNLHSPWGLMSFLSTYVEKCKQFKEAGNTQTKLH